MVKYQPAGLHRKRAAKIKEEEGQSSERSMTSPSVKRPACESGSDFKTSVLTFFRLPDAEGAPRLRLSSSSRAYIYRS
jgi:hypothetical protein